MSLPQSTIHTIKATYPVLQEYGEDIALCLHKVLLVKYPQTWATFVKSAEHKPRVLATAMAGFARSIDNLDDKIEIEACLTAIGVFTRLDPAQYPMLGDALLTALQDELGGTLSGTALDAWKEAFFCLTDKQPVQEPRTGSA